MKSRLRPPSSTEGKDGGLNTILLFFNSITNESIILLNSVWHSAFDGRCLVNKTVTLISYPENCCSDTSKCDDLSGHCFHRVQ